MINDFTSNSLVSGSGAVQTFLRNGLNFPAEGVKSYIIIETGVIPANQSKVLLLSTRQLTLQLLSVFLDINSTTANNEIDFEVLYQGNTIFKMTIDKNSFPYQFPPIILTPDLDIKITPKVTIDRFIATCQQVVIADRIVFT